MPVKLSMTGKAYLCLNRVTFGPRPEDIRYVEKIGWKNYVSEQLDPGDEPDRLTKMIQDDSYGWEFEFNGEIFQNKDKLKYYDLSIATLLDQFRERNNLLSTEKYILRRPYFETLIISWLKALHSPWQLRELMAEFWHNHFTVSADIEDGIASCLAVYDREAIRPNVLGNFRTMLEAVAKSPAMLHYLDNAVSRASPANENYARELFELHTMGAENYYNHLYDDWKEVPGALDGLAEGYIDEDVYEAARAFTGWTVAYKSDYRIIPIPSNGEFYYFDRWHDPYKKRILGVEFKSHQGPMEDGLKVLDLVAYHPKTARFLCTKLCRWMVADNPPDSIVDKAVETWMEHLRSPHQIRETLRTILLSPEFESHLGTKIKRPNHLVLAYVRMVGAELTPHESVFWWIRKMGYHQFTSPFPTGNPDVASHWINSDALLKRWQSFPELEKYGSEEGFFTWDVLGETPTDLKDFDELLFYWSKRLLDGPVSKPIRSELRDIFFKDLKQNSLKAIRETDPETYEFRVKQMVRLLCMSPEFQKR